MGSQAVEPVRGKVWHVKGQRKLHGRGQEGQWAPWPFFVVVPTSLTTCLPQALGDAHSSTGSSWALGL